MRLSVGVLLLAALAAGGKASAVTSLKYQASAGAKKTVSSGSSATNDVYRFPLKNKYMYTYGGTYALNETCVALCNITLQGGSTGKSDARVSLYNRQGKVVLECGAHPSANEIVNSVARPIPETGVKVTKAKLTSNWNPSFLKELTLTINKNGCKTGNVSGSEILLKMRVNKKFDLYVDGVKKASGDDPTITHAYLLSAKAKVVGIMAENAGDTGGILASMSNGIISDGSWKCKSVTSFETDWASDNFDDSHWPSAKVHGTRSADSSFYEVRQVSPRAHWIWTINNKNDPKVFCRKALKEDLSAYHFPHKNVYMSTQGKKYDINELCVTRCDASIKAATNNASHAIVYLLSGSGRIEIACTGIPYNKKTAEASKVSKHPGGVKISKIHLYSWWNPAYLEWLRLTINMKGCQHDGDHLYLYSGKKYSGVMVDITQTTNWLDNFNDQTSSVRISGTGRWQLYEHANFNGKSVVLDPGDYEDISHLPGDNILSSIQKLPTKVSIVTEGPRCFKRSQNYNTIWGLVRYPAQEDQPNTFYLGNFPNDVTKCEDACRIIKECVSYTLFQSSHTKREWHGMCYGRSNYQNKRVREEGTTSGIVTRCDEVDAIILYENENFGGKSKVLTNNTEDLGAFDHIASSINITGKKSWQVFTNKNYSGLSTVLAPGQYRDLAARPVVKAVSSVKFYVRPPPKMSAPAPKEKECKTVQRAEVIFLVDASGSVGQTNFKTILTFVKDMIDQLDIRTDRVRVGVIRFAYRADESVPLGSINQKKSLKEAILKITYTRGSTNTHKALDNLQRVMTSQDVRRGVPKIAILITDGKSNSPYSTKASAKKARDAGIKIMAVGIKNANMDELKAVADHKDQVFTVTDFTGLSILTSTLSKITCTIIKKENEKEFYCPHTQRAEVAFLIDESGSVGYNNFQATLRFIDRVINKLQVSPSNIRIAALKFGTRSHIEFDLATYKNKTEVMSHVSKIHYGTGITNTHLALADLRTKLFTRDKARPDVPLLAVIVTDGKSTKSKETQDEAKKVRAHGIMISALGVKNADRTELKGITDNEHLVYMAADFNQLQKIENEIANSTCQAITEAEKAKVQAKYFAINKLSKQEDDYFVPKSVPFKRLPQGLGIESGRIPDNRITASSYLEKHAPSEARPNRPGGWVAYGTRPGEYIQVNLGRVSDIHGIGTQSHGVMDAWVKAYKLAVSLDNINFEILQNKNKSDLVFEGNKGRNTMRRHCLHKLFGKPVTALSVKLIPVQFHKKIALRFELYGFTDPDDPELIKVLKTDVWTRKVTGCRCYFDTSREDCACCEEGGCQCSSSNYHQCVQCGSPHKCGKPNPRNQNGNIDGWTKSSKGCRCHHDPTLTNCACCQNYGCQCGSRNMNQCVVCGHPDHCGKKEHIFGTNNYCVPKTCPQGP